MSTESTRGPADHDRERRDRLEHLQTALREAKAALAQVEGEARRAGEAREAQLAAAQRRLADAERRHHSLTTALRACQIRRDDLRKMIHKARVDRDGPVERVGWVNDGPGEDDWSMQARRRSTWFDRQPGWVQLLIIVGGLALYALLFVLR